MGQIISQVLHSKENEINALSENPITLEEAAGILKVQPVSLRRIAHQGKVPCYKATGRLLFFKSELRQFILSGRLTK